MYLILKKTRDFVSRRESYTNQINILLSLKTLFIVKTP